MYKVISIIIVYISLIGCDMQPTKEIGYGVIKDGVYINEYFNLSIEVPEDWAVQSQAAQQQLMDSGTELIAGDNNNLKSIMKESQKQSVNLFTFFKYEQGAPVPFNPSIISVAERMSHMPGVKRGSDYLFHVKNILTSGQMNYEFSDDIYSKDISGISFDVLTTEINTTNFIVYQEYYAARINDYVLTFILSHSSKSEKDELEMIFDKINFAKTKQ